MSKVYSIASQKGGTGKTSTTISIAAGLARQGKKVLIIDIDSQANASKVLLPHYQQDIRKEDTLHRTIIERKPLPIHSTGVSNLNIVPSHILLSDTDVVLTTALDHREARLKEQLDKVKEQYDFIFIDCPPALGWLSINAFTASDEIIVVISPGYFELESTIQIGKTIREVQENFNPALKLRGFLFTMSDPTVNSWARRLESRPSISAPPIAGMQGKWTLQPRKYGGTSPTPHPSRGQAPALRIAVPVSRRMGVERAHALRRGSPGVSPSLSFWRRQASLSPYGGSGHIYWRPIRLTTIRAGARTEQPLISKPRYQHPPEVVDRQGEEEQ